MDMAVFLQETVSWLNNWRTILRSMTCVCGQVQEMAKSMAKGGSPSEKSAKELMQLLEDVRCLVVGQPLGLTLSFSSVQLRSGKPLPNESIVACAKIFTDEITLDNISRAQVMVFKLCCDHVCVSAA
jgi:hypothetical protein